ncbi:Protein STRUBBELIG-RECEPTOR FAMILY 1 [Dichanthelium oligosanthes]|uniref:Protein STRUBBELIG-RECEPTOR FAMILY 1 n=1 Tax=Dichanthelium oligosanthes TaxID=888268 RepID=A0A1E5VPQ0_9POAL|nr:Protein STRUBBELIG-RECEPTOR FAMILY 1 [Dichanthelium oligosanthes]
MSKPACVLRVFPPLLVASAAILLLLSTLPRCQPYTYEQDVFAINGLYTALQAPQLPNWTTNGGDPCNEGWQGVSCVASNITSIILSGANLGGQLGNTLGNFTSLITLDLSNNNIGGTIPDGLPVTMQKFFLSANQLSGSLPSTLSSLTLLTSMSLNNNQLTGDIPDIFAALTGLANLNIENNLFSGPVPVKLLNLPNFKKDGNPFNTSIAPSAQPPAAPTPLPSVSPPARHVPSKEPSTSSSVPGGSTPGSGKHTVSILKLVGYILIGVVSAVVIALILMYCLSKYKERKSRNDIYTKNKIRRVSQKLGEPKIKEVAEIKQAPVKVDNDVGKASNVVSDAKEEHRLKMPTSAAPGVVTMKQKEHVIDMEKADNFVEEQLHSTKPVALPTEKVIVNPSVRTRKGRVPSVGKVDLITTVKSFSIASLQQYTNSFSEENFIRDSRFGKVYLAELPDGELLEVLKIDSFNSKVPVDAFLELVVSISEVRHPNILGLVGYCAEFEQRLLVYEHCSKMTLHDELHYVDDSSKPLSWNARLQVAVGAAKALQHLHDGCQPPIVHQNFEPSVVLLNSTLVVHISESGLASLASKSVSQLSGHTLFHYEAPEVHESGSISDRSDVYSFGVVMLELLTGRKPYDSSRPRAEQHLVRWATSQLYDIDAIAKMVDPSIQGQCSEKALSRFADIISSCIQECEAKFAEIQSRYSACNAWFEELRKQRVAELKRELEKSENSIGSLQSVIESLSNNKHGDGSSECRTSHNESCSHSENTAGTSSGKEASRDRSSAASFTEEASNGQKSQQVQRCDTDSIQANNPSPDESYPQAQVEKVCSKDILLWGSRKQRGRRARTLMKGDDSSRDGESTSTACIEREGSSEGFMKDLKTPKVESSVMKKGLKTPKVESGVTNKDLKTPNVGSGLMKKCSKTPSGESDVMKKGLKTPKAESDVSKVLKTPKAESGVMKVFKTPKAESDVMKKGLKTPKAECSQPVIERVKQKLTEILKTISTQGDCLMLQRQLDTQRKRVRYKKMIRRHMDFRTLHSKIRSGAIFSTKELLRDILIFVNNVIAFYPKATLEHMAAVELRDLSCKIVKQSASFVLKSHGEKGTAGASVVKKTAPGLQPGRPGPGDARGGKVSSREATAKEGEGKNSRSDASLTANQKTTQRNEPAKKRGVGRPPKSGQKTAGAQEDSPSKGRKRGAGAQVDSPSKGRKRSAAAQEDSLNKGGKKSRR